MAAATPVQAQDEAPAKPPAAEQGGGSDLAKQLANPAASLISVPFQNNIDCCYGPEEGVRYTLNVQPVIPVSISKDWNVIIRTIVPIIHQGEVVEGQGSVFGFGDTVQSFFVTPKAVKNGFVWAIGPVFLYPTGESSLGSKKWGAGPTVLVLKQAKGGITAGVLANHIWSVAGDHDREDVSTTFIQPFLSKTLPDSTTFSVSTESTFNWRTEKWVVPINIGVSHIFRFGKQPVQIGPAAKYYVSSPTGGPKWGARLSVTLLFPKK
jgi:hypothetical protein